MAYTLNLTNGETLVPGGLSDGKIDTDNSSLVLVGRDYAGYGQFINENFIKLLENFAFNSGPPNPLSGQLWWDTTNNILRVWSGTTWKISTGATAAPFVSPPGDLSTLGGDLWFDKTNGQLKVWNGDNAWVLVGPPAPLEVAGAGLFPVLMADSSSITATRAVIQIQFAGQPYAIISKDTFNSNLSGFPLIRAGINFKTDNSPLWGIGTQNVQATPNSLVERDATGGVVAVQLTATTVVAGAITASSIIGPLQGDVSGNVTAVNINATTVTASAVASTGGISATSGFSGTILTTSQPNITTLGNVNNLLTNGNTSLTGYATYNGSPIATIGGSASFSSINYTPIGNIGASTGIFTTLAATTSNIGLTSNVVTLYAGTILANTIQANIIGNTGATLIGNLGTGTQPNLTTALALTGVGLISSGTWRGTAIQPAFGGTGINNGTNTLTYAGNYTLNQSVAAGASPTFVGTNFSLIPNSALTYSNITINGSEVSLGGSLNTAATVANLTAGTGITVSSATGAVTISANSSASVQYTSLGVGTAASGNVGEIRATNNITAYYSDDRLKTRLGKIENALDKVDQLTGFYYEANQTAQDLGYTVKREVGVSAQDVQKVLPEIVVPAPIDDKYLTIYYEKLVPLLIEAIKELRLEMNDIKGKL